jgi:hypothetical protein
MSGGGMATGERLLILAALFVLIVAVGCKHRYTSKQQQRNHHHHQRGGGGQT